MPLADGSAGGQNGLFLVEIVGAAPWIGTALGCVGDDLHLRRTAGGLFQRVIHGAVADDVGGLHHDLLPAALHQRRQGVQQHRLLVPRHAVAVKNGHAASLYGLRIPVDGRHPPCAGDSSPPLPERGSGAQYPPRFAVYPELPVGIQRPDILEVVQQRGSRPPPGAAAAHHHVAVHVLPRRAAAAEEQVAGVPSAHKVGAAVDDEVLVVAAVVGAPEPGQPQGIVKSDLRVFVSRQRLERGAALQMQLRVHAVHQKPHLHAPLRRVQQRRHHIRAAFVNAEIKGREDDLRLCRADEPQPPAQRLLVAIHKAHPLGGGGGQFDLPVAFPLRTRQRRHQQTAEDIQDEARQQTRPEQTPVFFR